MKIQTVNIIELVGGCVNGVTSFAESEEGNKEAEAHYATLIREYDSERTISDEEMEAFVEDGYYQGSMDYEVLITHSK